MHKLEKIGSVFGCQDQIFPLPEFRLLFFLLFVKWGSLFMTFFLQPYR